MVRRVELTLLASCCLVRDAIEQRALLLPRQLKPADTQERCTIRPHRDRTVLVSAFQL